MEFVLGSDVRAHADDEDVAEAGGGGDHPDEDPQHDVGQQVLEGRDAVGVGFAAAHMRSVAAVLEFLEVAACNRLKKKRICSCKVWGFYPQVCSLHASTGSFFLSVETVGEQKQL